MTDETYHETPEQKAQIERAVAVWTEWKDVTIEGHKFTHIQESHVLNMLFRMQEAEHAHFNIEIPKGQLAAASQDHEVTE